MPELPEVESIRRALEPRLVGRAVLSATLRRRDILVAPGDPFGGYSRQRSTPARRPPPASRPISRRELLAGATITRLLRRGKQLAIIARHGDGSARCEAPERALVVQLGMSGQLLLSAPTRRSSRDDHVHASWRLDDARLDFRDPRRFGTLRIFASLADLDEHWASLGPDALELTPAQLAAAVGNSSRPLKALLLDQSAIAGIGNIYADEALFRARIHPLTPAGSLHRERIDALAEAIAAVLAEAVDAGGSTLRDYADPDGAPGRFQVSHAVYGRSGAPCLGCSRPLQSARVSQRTTVWCPRCQALR